MRPLVVVGDSLLDRDLDGAARRLAPDAPVPVVDQPHERARPGGAALAASLAAGDDREVVFVTALGDDAAGRRVAALLDAVGVAVVDVGLTGATPEKVRIRADGHPVVRVDRGAASQVAAPPDDALAPLHDAAAVLVSDYGRGIAAHPAVRAALDAVISGGGHVVWDPHPSGAAPCEGARLVTPNLAEAQHVGDPIDAASPAAVAALATRLRDRWGSAGVALTLGRRGALLVGPDDTPLLAPARALSGPVDPCGAGDRFAVAVAGGLADGCLLSEAVVDGVAAATAFVAAGGATAWTPDAVAVAEDPGDAGDDSGDDAPPVRVAATAADGDLRLAPATGGAARPGGADAQRRIARVRSRRGTVIATGGCFDLLHAGHVQLLDEARRLGDCLVVCVNSDRSVRRLKGPDRPVVGAADRRAVLLGLAAVDAVVVFDEDTPEQVLAELRPDAWVKGADYGVADLPEADLVASWGGQAIVLPYLAGRSTTSILEGALRHANT